jgi:hypothetical protein
MTSLDNMDISALTMNVSNLQDSSAFNSETDIQMQSDLDFMITNQ